VPEILPRFGWVVADLVTKEMELFLDLVETRALWAPPKIPRTKSITLDEGVLFFLEPKSEVRFKQLIRDL
jgi:hypothetical protein